MCNNLLVGAGMKKLRWPFTSSLNHISHFPVPRSSILTVSLFRLNVYLCHYKLNFHLSLLCLTPLFPPNLLHVSSSPFPSPSVSPIKYKVSHYPPKTRYSPTAPGEKAKIYKSTIFRFMGHCPENNIITTVGNSEGQ